MQKLDQVENRVNDMDQKNAQINQKLGEIEKRVNEIDMEHNNNYDYIIKKIDEQDAKFKSLSDKLDQLIKKLDR